MQQLSRSLRDAGVALFPTYDRDPMHAEPFSEETLREAESFAEMTELAGRHGLCYVAL
jgi:hypothetical protein